MQSHAQLRERQDLIWLLLENKALKTKQFFSCRRKWWGFGVVWLDSKWASVCRAVNDGVLKGFELIWFDNANLWGVILDQSGQDYT